LSLLAISSLGSLMMSRRLRARSSWNSAGELPGPLLQIVQRALIQPAHWGVSGDGSPLWRHRLLPVLGGGAVSLDRAQRLQRQKKLFLTANRNPLAAAMAVSGITVLDLAMPLFSPLRALLPGVVDADRLCRLRPVPPSGDGLLAAANVLGRRIGRKKPLLLVAPGLSGSDMLPVSLPAPLKSPPFFFPQRFIAIHPGARCLAQCSALYPRNQALAVLRFLRGAEGCRLPDPPFSPRSLKRCARRLLRSSHG
jgi:hypothetical protein